MIKHKDSHVDHGLSDLQLGYVMGVASALVNQVDRSKPPIDLAPRVVIQTIELPEWLGTVPCGLRGPIVGDPPITDDAVVFDHRGDRKYPSRLVALPPIQTNKVTVIAGPHDGHDLVLYTAFGGPKAPREVGELEAIKWASVDDAPEDSDHEASRAWREKMARLTEEIAQSDDFWKTHALCLEAEPEWFTWDVRVSVHKTWVADGFDVTDKRAERWLELDLSYAFAPEIKASVIKAPSADQVARAQGYKSAADRAERTKR